MGIVTGILVFVVIWWLIFFMSLPIGVQPMLNTKPEQLPGAPANPNLWWKAFWTSVLTTLIFILLYLFVPADLMTWPIFRDNL